MKSQPSALSRLINLLVITPPPGPLQSPSSFHHPQQIKLLLLVCSKNERFCLIKSPTLPHLPFPSSHPAQLGEANPFIIGLLYIKDLWYKWLTSFPNNWGGGVIIYGRYHHFSIPSHTELNTWSSLNMSMITTHILATFYGFLFISYNILQMIYLRKRVVQKGAIFFL